MKNGIDISYYQNLVDYKKLKDQGIDFVIIRIGYGKNKSQKDKCFDQHYTGCKEAGIKVGGYLYSYAQNMKDVASEIKNTLNIIKDKSFDLPIFYDLEEKDQDKKLDLTKAAGEWIAQIQNGGYKAGIYVNLDWYKRYFEGKNLPSNMLWLAQWNDNAKPDIPCGIWQYSNKGKLQGIKGNIDMDRLLIDDLLKNEKVPPLPEVIENNNTSFTAPNPPLKSELDIAHEVIQGFWSTGYQRKMLIEQAGYNYAIVQQFVNQLLAHTPYTYNIKKGDTLSAIAKKYNTTVSNLVKINNIKNPHFIKAGDTIKLR